MIAVELLEGVGYQVVGNNGEEAVHVLLADESIDIVLMDIQMPVLDGLEATKCIRKYPQFAGIPIIAMTARAMAGDKERSLGAGMSDHITMPIVSGELYAVLKRWLVEIELINFELLEKGRGLTSAFFVTASPIRF